jgi:RNA polymerase sigma-70 factor, ECF subfamily
LDPSEGPFEHLLGQAQRGDPDALASLYRRLGPAVLAYLRTCEQHEAEDLASQVWIDVATGLRRFTGDEAGFRRWVFTIARRRAIDMGRRRRSIDPQPAAEAAADAEQEALERISSHEALALIRSLPTDQAEVVILRVLVDRSVHDVAAILGKGEGAVRALQHRALRSLAKKISSGHNEPAGVRDVEG